MTTLIWPVETRLGATEPTPQIITWGSTASHHALNLGCDIHAVMHDYWVVIAHKGVPDVIMVGRWESLGDCGVACEIQWEWRDQRYNLRYCHGHEHYASRWPDVWRFNSWSVGELIGEVGMTGRTDGPHLHLAAAVGCPPGALLESGERYPADTLIREIIASYDNEEDDVVLTPEQQVALKLGEALMASVGNPDRPDLTVAWNLQEVTNGVGNWLKGAQSATRARRNNYGQQLTDVADVMKQAIEGATATGAGGLTMP